jgi:hypothetical protein
MPLHRFPGAKGQYMCAICVYKSLIRDAHSEERRLLGKRDVYNIDKGCWSTGGGVERLVLLNPWRTIPCITARQNGLVAALWPSKRLLMSDLRHLLYCADNRPRNWSPGAKNTSHIGVDVFPIENGTWGCVTIAILTILTREWWIQRRTHSSHDLLKRWIAKLRERPSHGSSCSGPAAAPCRSS